MSLLAQWAIPEDEWAGFVARWQSCQPRPLGLFALTVGLPEPELSWAPALLALALGMRIIEVPIRLSKIDEACRIVEILKELNCGRVHKS